MVLAFCEKCYQMTNHTDKGECLKCKARDLKESQLNKSNGRREKKQ